MSDRDDLLALRRMAELEDKARATPDPGQNLGDRLKGEGYERAVNYSPRDTIGGLVRGAGSIGATLARPFESGPENELRRGAMDEALTQLVGSNPESMGYRTNKMLAEIAGTSGVGGGIARAVGAIPGAAAALPTLLPAIASGGMTAGGANGLYGLASRVAGGAVTGGASAGLVEPQNALQGAVVGGVVPAAMAVGGGAMARVGEAAARPSVNPTMRETARQSTQAGYVIPPQMVAPSFGNRVLESVSGKMATQQIASTKNTAVTEKLVRQALGIADDVPITQSTLESLRKTAGRAYAEVSALSPQAGADLEALKTARNEAQGWFKAYNRSARPDDLAKAKEARALSDQLEAALEQHAADAGKPELIPALQEARKQIAKTYTVGRAVNDASGTVDARVLGRMHEKGMPLSDGLDVAGKFASAFPTVAKSPQQVGSPAVHNLNSLASMFLGGGGYMAGGPAGIAAAALPFVAAPAARSLMFSPRAQRNMLAELPPALPDPSLELLTRGAYRAAPVVIGR